MTGGDERRRPRLEPAWAGAVLTLSAAFAYLLGYLETAFFASALGITARDLGIDVKDYSVLALLNVAIVAVATLCLSAAYRCDPTDSATRQWITKDGGQAFARRSLATAGFLAFHVVAVAIGAAGFQTGVSSMGTILVPAGMAFLSAFAVRLGRVNFAALFASFAAVALVVIACASADTYARRLRGSAQDGTSAPMPPPALRSILQPEVGSATHGTATTCAIRVSPHVLIGRTATTVVTIDRFAVRHCDVADVPFG